MSGVTWPDDVILPPGMSSSGGPETVKHATHA